jgi:elongation factor G
VGEYEHTLAKQTGGRGQYARVKLQVEPIDTKEGFEFVDEITGGRIPREYIPAIERGIVATLSRGVYAGYPIVGTRVRLIDGKYHEVDSNEMAFRTCGSMAFSEAFRRGHPELLEPVSRVEITIPVDFAGVVTGDLCARRGRILGMEARAGAQVLSGEVPISEMFGYATILRTLTQGRGTFSMTFDRYETVPFSKAEEIVEARKEFLATRRV